jgi:hypothetical protein
MRNFANTRCAIFTAALILPLAAIAPASAFSGSVSAAGLRAAAVPAAIVQVHQRWVDDDDDDDHHARRHYRHHHDDDDDEVVDAPFTHVESGRRVIVDAPFAHVAVGRHGRHIVAPFVDLWVPR